LDSQKTESSHTPYQAVWLGLFLLGTLSLLFIPVPSHTFFWIAVNNSGHVPLFIVVAILLLKLSRALMERLGWPPIRHYAVAISGVVVLALVTEALQSLSSIRHPQASDAVHDFLGAMCGLGLSLTYDQSMAGNWALCRTFPRNMIIRLGLALVIVMTFLPVFEWAYAYWDRAGRFPSLLNFSSEWEMKFVKASNSELQVVVPPEGWNKLPEDKVGRVVFHPKRYPGIRIDEPYPDWRGYAYFQLEIFSELQAPQSITIRIDDLHHKNKHSDRFNRAITISPGLNHIQIPLNDIRQGPVHREMDFSAMKAILLFAVNPPKEFILYLDNVRLE
jgi:hypothetical protein